MGAIFLLYVNRLKEGTYGEHDNVFCSWNLRNINDFINYHRVYE